MLIIGEKLNSTISSVREAIKAKDVAFVQDLARKQTEAGAHFLDVNTAMGNEVEDMEWMVRTVQAVVDTPLCIDSTNPEAIQAALKIHKGKAMINSISLERGRVEGILPLVQEYGCSVVALTLDDNGIPKTAEERLQIAGRLVGILTRENVDLHKVYIDPLVLPLAVNSNNAQIFFQCIREIKNQLSVKTVSGLSNVSHSLPKRKLINRYFLTIALACGMDAAILDPLDGKLMTAVKTTQLLLDQDRFSRKYLQAFRAEMLED